MKSKVNNISLCSIDSFKYRIELHKVEVTNRNLLDHIIKASINSDTGELLDSYELKSNSLKVEFDYYQIHFAVNDLFGKKYLVILINSKLLEIEYLDGISMKNIEKIYNKIISANIIKISFEDFLSQGLVSDIDIKKDFELSTENFKSIIQELENNTIPHKKSKYGCNAFTQSQNLGIEWNKRENASASRPFLKLYHKEIESKFGKNREFFLNYVNSNKFKSMVRAEATIKNALELRKYGISNTLIGLLQASPDDLTKVISNAIELNLEPRIKQSTTKTKSDLNAIETIIFAHITNMITNQNISFESALNYTLNHFEDKQSKYRNKKIITQVYETQINGKISEVKTKEFSNFFETLGWGEITAV